MQHYQQQKNENEIECFPAFYCFFFRSTSESRGKSPLFSISQAFWVEKAINFVPQFFFFFVFFHPSHKNQSLIAFVRSHFIWYIWFRNNLRDAGNHPKMLINIFKKCPNRQIAYTVYQLDNNCVCVCVLWKKKFCVIRRPISINKQFMSQ